MKSKPKEGLHSRSPGMFNWKAALLGGVAAIGAGAFFGTVVTNVSLYLSMARGASLQEAYADLAFSFVSGVTLVSLCVQVLSGALGGAIATHIGKAKPALHAFAAGCVGLAFVIAMYISPSIQPGPMWYVALSLALPLLSSLLGGAVYARRS